MQMFLATLLAAAAVAVPTTQPATDVGATGATLNGTVDGPSEAYFEYGTATTYGLKTATQSVPAGPVTATIPGGLTIDTLYHYRIVSEEGPEGPAGDVPGQDMTFRTAGPPAVSNQVASNVTPTEATVSASVDTKGLRTSYRIEWGTSTRYGRFTPVVSADSGTAAANVTLTGLQPNRTYHWRTRASNAAGTSLGANRTFRTAALPSAVTLSLSRGTVPWGGDVRLGGRVSGAGVGGMTVALEQQRLGLDPGFSETATARTGSDGGYLFTIPRLWTTTSYRVVTKTQVVATSPVATARSRVKVGVRVRHVARKRARVEGAISPGVQGTATLQLYRSGRGWRTVRSATLAPTDQTRSRYRFIVRRLKRVSRRFRVIGTPASEAQVRGSSRSVTVRARPRR